MIRKIIAMTQVQTAHDAHTEAVLRTAPLDYVEMLVHLARGHNINVTKSEYLYGHLVLTIEAPDMRTMEANLAAMRQVVDVWLFLHNINDLKGPAA